MNMNAMKGVKRKRKSEPSSDNLKQATKKKRVSFSTSFETRIIGTKEEFNKSTNNLPGIDLQQLELEEKPRKSILKKTPPKPRVLKKKVSLSKEDSVDSNSINAKPPSPKVTKPSPSKSKDNKKEGNEKKLLTQSNPQKFAFKKRVLKVRKSTKEILKTLNKKERREFIRQLEAKNKPNFDLVRQAKLFWETIRSSKAPADEKEESIKKLMELCNGKMGNLVYTHGTSRVLQCLLKLKKPAIRQAIFEELKPEILGMAKSRYAKYFVAKMLKYGSKEQRDEVINALKGNYVSLFKAAYSAELLDAIYGEWATAEQYHAIITEFYGPEFQLLHSESNHPTRTDIGAIVSKNPEKGQIILKNLEAILETAVQKIPTLKLSITHRLLLDYLTHCSEEQRKSMIDSLKDQLPEICHTREGSRAALMCIWHANPKERKAIVKSFKGLTIRSCQDSFARRVLFAIFDSVDDTVLVNKIITQEIANNIADVIYNKNGVWVLHYLVHPRDQRVIGKGLYEMLKSGDTTRKTKKEPAIRYAELFNCVRSALLDFMKANMREMISNKISSVLILDTLEVHAPTDPFERNIPEADLHACFRAITEIAADEFIPHALGGPSHIVQGGCSRFVFRKLLQSDPRRPEGSKLSDFLADLPPESLASWTGMDCGCYTLVEMLKSGSAKAKEALKTALNESSLKNSSLNGAAKLLTELIQEGPMESKPATESPTKLPQGKMNAAGKRTLKMGNKKNPKSWNR